MDIKKFKCGAFDTNTILIGCEDTKEAAIIDPASSSLEKILKYTESKGFKLKYILLTHSHWDHITDVVRIKEKTGAKILIHQLDEENLKNPGSDGLPAMESVEPIEADGYLEDNQELNIGKIKIKVLHTPGHSPGSVCFYIEDEKILISGDTLFPGAMGTISFPLSEPKLMFKSLKRLSKLPKDVLVIPGHGEDTTIGKENWLEDAENYFKIPTLPLD